ncbi:MAG: ATP-binding cassette domain-containing protein, partial [Actinobacteria bacterium]|nr:ATP-binding cassette domain-containing protein [Actinomycetota bacterium]
MARTPRSPRPRTPEPDKPAPLPPGALDIVGIAKNYGDAPALEPVNLRVEHGERVALIGHNGSGKTTMIRIITGLLDATEGTSTICGHATGSIGARAAVSYVADQPTFYDDLT